MALATAAGTIAAAWMGSCGSSGAAGVTGASGGAPPGTGGSTTVVFVGSGAGGAGCGGPPATDGGGGDGPTGCEGIEGGVTFAAARSAVFSGCQGEVCHIHDVPTPQWLAQPATECCDGRLRAMPGNAARSYVLDKIENHDLCGGERMPFGGPYLDASQALIVRRWICGGAPAQ